MKLPYHKCPRFSSCSVPKCPLDPDYHQRARVIGEEHCNLRKSIRLKIAKEFTDVKLAYEGYTPAEARGYRSFSKVVELKSRPKTANSEVDAKESIAAAVNEDQGISIACS